MSAQLPLFKERSDRFAQFVSRWVPDFRHSKPSAAELEAIYQHRARLAEQYGRAKRHRRTRTDLEIELRAATTACLRSDMRLAP